MKIESLRIVLPVVVGSAIPLFFVAVYIRSTCNRLRSLRVNCQRTADALRSSLAEHRQVMEEFGGHLMRRGSGSGSGGAAANAQNVQQTLARAGEQVRDLDASERNSGPALQAAWEQLEWAQATLNEIHSGLPAPGSNPERAFEDRLTESKRTSTAALANYNQAASAYNAARERGLTRLLAAMCGWPRAEIVSARPG